jgi:uncharacterized Zn-binding protein involved in type VI secretion
MRSYLTMLPVAALTLASMVQCGSAWGQTPGAGQPGVITGGSESVTINGKPAARQGDTTTGGALVEGSPNVFINGKPAVIGDRNGCGGAIVSGGHGVFINGKPMARQGDQTSGCAK